MIIGNSEALGKAVKAHRKKAGLTRASLSLLAGVGKTVIFDIENGKDTVKLRTLLKVLAVLNIRIHLAGPFTEA